MSAKSWMQILRGRGSFPFLEDELPKQSRGPVLETLALTRKQGMDSGNRNKKEVSLRPGPWR